MKLLMTVATAALICINPASAFMSYTVADDIPLKPAVIVPAPYVMTVPPSDASLTLPAPAIQLQPEEQPLSKHVMKEPFAVRHPKLHNAGRKIRRMCQVSLPVLQAIGCAAQIATAFR